MLAALTSRRSLVQIQPGLLNATPVAQRRRHLLDVEATPQVRVLPGVLTGLEVLRPHAALVSAEDRVRFPAGPLQATWGRMFRGGEGVSHAPWVGPIPIVSTDRKPGLWSNGTTPAWRAGNAGSIPAGSTERRRVAGYGLMATVTLDVDWPAGITITADERLASPRPTVPRVGRDGRLSWSLDDVKGPPVPPHGQSLLLSATSPFPSP